MRAVAKRKNKKSGYFLLLYIIIDSSRNPQKSRQAATEDMKHDVAAFSTRTAAAVCIHSYVIDYTHSEAYHHGKTILHHRRTFGTYRSRVHRSSSDYAHGRVSVQS